MFAFLTSLQQCWGVSLASVGVRKVSKLGTTALVNRRLDRRAGFQRLGDGPSLPLRINTGTAKVC